MAKLNLDGLTFERRPGRTKGQTKYAAKVFDKAWLSFNDRLNQSIAEAEGRYGEGWEARAAGAAGVDTADGQKQKAFAAPFWRVTYVETVMGKQMPHPDSDIVEVKLKVANTAWDGVFPPDDNGNPVTAKSIRGNQLIELLGRIRTWVDNWGKEEKDAFHKFAIEVLEPPQDKTRAEEDKQYRYDENEDRYVKR